MADVTVYPAEACPYAGERFENQSGPEGPGGGGRRIWVDIRCTVGGRPRGICNWACWENWAEVCVDYQRARAEAWKEAAGRLACIVRELRRFIEPLESEEGLEDDERVRLGVIDYLAIEEALAEYEKLKD